MSLTSNPNSKRRNSRVSLGSDPSFRCLKSSNASIGSNGSKKRADKMCIYQMLTPELKSNSKKDATTLNEINLDEVMEEEMVMPVPFKIVYSKKNENLRATFMLILVCAFFLVSEFPQFVLIIFSLLDQQFYENIYIPLGDLLEVIVLFFSMINFLLYCFMSKSFRSNFLSYFKKDLK